MAIAAYPVDNRGHIGIHVSLGTEPGVRPEARPTASMELFTTYGELE